MRSSGPQKRAAACRARPSWASWPRSAGRLRQRLEQGSAAITGTSACQAASSGLGRAHSRGARGCFACAGRFDEPTAVEIQNKQTQARRQIALLAVDIDRRNETRQGGPATDRDLFERLPERVLQTDAGL